MQPSSESGAISAQDLARLRDTGVKHVLLDVREANEFAFCQIDGALHIPMRDVAAHIDDLPTDQPLVVMCHHGGRSQRVVNFLRNAGFENG